MIYFIIAVVLAVLGWFLFGPNPPVKYRKLTQPFLRDLIKVLYYRGFDGGQLEIHVKHSQARVTLKKDIVADNDVHLRTDLSLDDLPGITREVVEEAIRSSRLLASSNQLGAHPGVMKIDFGGDFDAAEGFVRFVLERASNSRLDDNGFAMLRDVAEGSYEIGWTTT